MELNEILSKVDHTLLAQTATWAEIKAICDDGMKYHTASVCIPASYVKQAKDYVGDKLPICTVIGFPNGYDTTKAKCLEALDAVQNGADEVDMVINIGWVKDQRWDDLLEEIKAVKQHCEGKLLKVIIETCLLTDDEKIKMCEIVSDSGADYIKTSTGFSTGGATFHDVELFAKHVKPGVKIKAAGGISSLDDAEKFIELGASRLGTSRVVKIVKSSKRRRNNRHIRCCTNIRIERSQIYGQLSDTAYPRQARRLRQDHPHARRPAAVQIHRGKLSGKCRSGQ